MTPRSRRRRVNKLGVNSAGGERGREIGRNERKRRKEMESYMRGIFGNRDYYWLMLIGKKLRG